MEIYRPILAGIVLIIVPLSGFPRGQRKPELATVHLEIVVAHSGEEIGHATVDLFTQEFGGGAENFAEKFQRNTASKIPYGIYRLRAHATGFYSREKVVYIFQPETWVVLGLDLGTESQLTYSASGKGQIAQPYKAKLRFRLMNVFSDISLDTKPEPSGEFKFAGVPQGRYILATILGNRVIDAKPVEIPAKHPIILNLSGLENSE